MNDYHAAILHQLSIDHTRLTYRYSDRDFRLTNVDGNVIEEILVYVSSQHKKLNS